MKQNFAKNIILQDGDRWYHHANDIKVNPKDIGVLELYVDLIPPVTLGLNFI